MECALIERIVVDVFNDIDLWGEPESVRQSSVNAEMLITSPSFGQFGL